MRDLLKRFNGLGPEEQQAYARFLWPESMEIAGIPWEGSGAVLDLLVAAGRVTVRHATWYWRVSCARPDAPSWERVEMARLLAVQDGVGGLSFDAARSCEYWLAFQPWTAEGKQRYAARLAETGIERWRSSSVKSSRSPSTATV